MKIKKITKYTENKPSYDIQVDDFSCYVANDIVVHNTDGQNLVVTWRDGRLKGARNKTTVIEPLDIQDMAKKFADRGELTKAFTNSMEDLQAAIGGLVDPVKYFGDGFKYLSIEIIYPPTKNVIDYGNRAIIQFHDITTFDRNGNKGDVDQASAQRLFSELQKNDALKQKTFEIVGAQQLKPSDLSTRVPVYLKQLKSIQGNLKDSQTVGDYYDLHWYDVIKRKYPKIDSKYMPIMVARFSRYQKTVNKAKFKKDDPIVYDAMEYFDKNHSEYYKEFKKPLETLIMGLGAEILSHATGFITANPNNTISDMKKNLDEIVNSVAKGKIDDKLMAKMQYHLSLIDKIGVENLAPSEGLVFKYKGRVFKLTGLFSSFNQILGVFKYGR